MSKTDGLESKVLWKLSTPGYYMKNGQSMSRYSVSFLQEPWETYELQAWTRFANWVGVLLYQMATSCPLIMIYVHLPKIGCQTAETQVGQQLWGHMGLLEPRISRNLSTLTVTMRSASHQRQGINRSELCLQQQQQHKSEPTSLKP